jgi:hypothetical protein
VTRRRVAGQAVGGGLPSIELLQPDVAHRDFGGGFDPAR